MSAKTHILNTAENLFNRYGYTAVGIDRIRDEAAVSKTTLYRHFGGKNGLIAAVMARRHERFQISLDKAVSLQQGAEGKLLAIFDWHLEWFAQPDFSGCMFMHALSEFKGVEEALAQQAKEHKTWLCSLIEDAVVDADVTPETVLYLMTLIEGLIVRAEFGASRETLSAHRPLLTEILNMGRHAV